MTARWTARVLPAAIVVLGLAFALVPLAQGRVFFYWDNAQQHYAQTVFLQQGLEQGAMPQWWPDVGLGFPTTAEGQAAHYHPIRLLCALLFPAPVALMWELALYFAIAGISTYFFLRTLGLHRMACLTGAASQMFCSFAIVYVRNLALHRSFCLLPLAMLCAERCVRRGDTRSWLLAIVVFGVQFLSGHPSFAIVTVVATTIYIAFRMLQQHWKRRTPVPDAARAFVMRIAAWGAIAVLGMMLAAVQVVPTLKHTEESLRQGGLRFDFATGAQQATLRGLGQILFPYAYTQGDFLPEATWWGRYNPVPNEGIYGGVLCVVLAPLALWWRRRSPDAAVSLAASFLIAIGFALGAAAPLFPLLWSLPGMNGLRFPSRFLLWASFSLSCLAAIGLHRLIAVTRLRMPLARQLAPLAAIAVMVLVVAAALWAGLPRARGGLLPSLAAYGAALVLAVLVATTRGRVRGGVLVLVAALAVGDLLQFRARGDYAPSMPIDEAIRAPAPAEFLQQDPDRFRIISLTATEYGAIPLETLQDYVQADTCTIWGIDTVDIFLSLYLKRHFAVRHSIVQELLVRPDSAQALASYLGAMNVKYAIAPAGLTLAGWQRVFDGPRTTAWRNPAVLPRAFLVGRVVPQTFELTDAWRRASDERLAGYQRMVADWSSRAVDAQIVDHVMAAGLDYSAVAEVESPGAIAIAPLDPSAVVRAGPDEPDTLRFSVTTSAPAFLVIANSAYPGWRATVNGRPAELHQTNWVMTGLPVPAGASEVVLTYTTPGYRTGLVVSAVMLALVGGLLVAFPRVQRVRRQLAGVIRG